MKTKEEKALEYAIKENCRTDKCLGTSTYDDYLAGYEAAESDARERAVKALNIILGEISIDVMTDKFKLGYDYREKFLKLYDNGNS